MAFTIKIGYTADNPQKVSKTVTWIDSSVSISPLSTINQLNPVFIVDYSSSYLTANYVECTDLGRKYFCTVSMDTAQRIILTCKVDVLSSFDLSECDITVTRNEGIGAPTKIPDSRLPVLPNIEEVLPTIAESDYFQDTTYIDPKYIVITVKAGEIE